MTVQPEPNDGKISAADLKKLGQYRKDIQSIKETLDNSVAQYQFTSESLLKFVQRLDNIRKFFVTLEQMKPTGYDKLIEAALECLRNSCMQLNLARVELDTKPKSKTKNYFMYLSNGRYKLDELLKAW